MPTLNDLKYEYFVTALGKVGALSGLEYEFYKEGGFTSNPPVVTAETVDFGAKTLINSGDYALTASGSPTSWAITGGTASSQYNIDSSGVLTSAVANPTGGTLMVTATNSVGTGAAATITVNSVANAYSVAPSTNETQLEQATEAAGLALGDSILLRSGAYNEAQNVGLSTKRTVAISGTWDGSNYVNIGPHTGALPAVWLWNVDGNFGFGEYFRFHDLDFLGKNDGTHGGSSSGLLMFTNGCNDIMVEDCTFTGPASNSTTALNLACGIWTSGTDFIIRNNSLVNTYNGINSGGTNTQIIGNDINAAWEDCIKVNTPFSNGVCSWNNMYNKKFLSGAPHNDAIQGNFSAATLGDLDDMTFEGNVMFRGDGESGQSDFQLIFLDDNTVSIRRAVIRGNMGICMSVNGIYVKNPVDCEIVNNVIINDTNSPSTGSTIIALHDTGSGNKVSGNITNGQFIDSGVTGTEWVNNTEIVASLVNYQTIFDDPKFLDGNSDVATFLSNYSIKSGGGPDLSTPKQGGEGTGYIDYTLRTIDIPPLPFEAADWSVADKATGGTVTVTISTIPYDNGSAVTDIEYSVDNGTWTSSGLSATGSFDISGLTDDQSYAIEVRSVTAEGNGPDSDSKNVTPTSAAYSQNLVNFDGTNDYFTGTSSAIADDDQYTFSAWLNPDAGIAGTSNIYDVDGRGHIRRVGDNVVILLKDIANATLVNYASTSNNFTTGSLHHVHVRADAVTGDLEIRIDGVLSSTTFTPSGLAIENTRNLGFLATNGGGSKFFGDVGDYYYAIGEYRPYTDFQDGSNNPVDISSFATSDNVWRGGAMVASNWNTSDNNGTATITQVGAVTDA